MLMFFLACEDEEQKECIDESKAGPRACTYNINPVCGCNGVTYDNACLAESAGVLHWDEGSCAK
jgi:hypothetical protein